MHLLKPTCIQCALFFTFVASREVNEIYKEDGETVELICPLEGDMIGWVGPPGLMSYGLGVEVFVPGVTISRKAANLSSLIINKFSNANEGKYRCENINEDYSFEVTMKRDPRDITIDNETDTGVIYGVEFQPLTLRCSVISGAPKEKLQWFKDGQLVSEGGPGSITYKLNGSRLHHKLYYTCKAASPRGEILLQRHVQLYIIRKPNVTLPEELTLTEGDNFTKNCSYESNDPETTVRWFRQGTEVSEPLQYTPVSRIHAGNYTCEVESRGGNDIKSVHLIVKYSPDVIITSSNFEQKLLLYCNATGVPANYSYKAWEHMTLNGDHLRFMKGTENGQLTIDDSLKHSSYHNSGIYTCNVSNGVRGSDETYDRSASYTLQIPGKPFFLPICQKRQFGIYGRNAMMTTYVYSYPDICNVSILDDQGHVLEFQERLSIQIAGTTVTDSVYGKTVSVSAKMVKVKLISVVETDFRNYTIQVKNNVTWSTFSIELKSANKPEPPNNVTTVAYGNTIKVSWTAGFDGGYPQTFVVQYMSTRVPNRYITCCEKNDSEEETHSAVLDGLAYSTQYLIRLYSYNSVNRSDFTEPNIPVVTGVKMEDVSRFVIPTVLAVTVVIFMVLTVSVLYKKGYMKRIINRSREFLIRHLPEVVVGVEVENEDYQPPDPPLPHQVSSAASNQLYSSIDRRRCVRLGQEVSYISNGEVTDQYHERMLQSHGRVNNNNLIYIDVCFDQPSRQFYIHGSGNRTPYADIDFNYQMGQLPGVDVVDRDEYVA